MIRGLKISILFILTWHAVQAQDFYLNQDIPVEVNGEQLANAWAGGLVAPQFNLMDADFDGDEDLVVFDRYNDRLLVFIWQDEVYTYTPEMAMLFPETLDNWVLLRDFNGDGKKDIFASTPLGMEVFVNEGSAEQGLRWRRYHDRSPVPSPLLTQGFNSAINLQLNATDIPAIDDIDGDGDLDILVFRFAGGSTVEWHRNFALERSGSLDSLQLERVTSGWGEFRECICGTFSFNNEDCPLTPGRPMHEGGKTLLALDLDGDGDRDVAVSEETCDNLFFLENGGTPENALMTDVLQNVLNVSTPFFPAAYYDDFDHDGSKEMILATNWPSVRETYPERIDLFQNNGSDDTPEFQYSSDNYLISSMIDVGGLSHPAFYDIDNDGDLDMISGYYLSKSDDPSGGLYLFRNVGTRTNPSFQLEDDDYLGLQALKIYQVRPVILDMTGDGIADLAFTASSEGLGSRLYVVTGTNNSNDPFPGTPVAVFTEFGEQDVVSVFDLTGDAIPDAIVGRAAGRVDLYKGARNGAQISFDFEDSEIFGLGNDNFRGATFLAREDLNGDGIADLFRSDSRGGTAWLESGNEENQWIPVTLYATREREAVHRPGRDIAPVFTNILSLDRDQLVIGSGGGGIQILQAFDANIIPPGERFFDVFPNPAVSRQIIFVRSSQRSDLTITDMSGRILATYDGIPASINYSVDISGFSAGMYILSGSMEDGSRISRKLIIVR